ncbi:hypothetical protein A3742_20950 [Oleiphilus sp. HI0071]|nr:hypothetical protein A3742_20950 [Oleiphilus sp. HI0071]
MGSASDSALMLGLGILCILFALWARLQQALMRFKGARFFWSTSSGLSSTLVHAGGPPINIYFVSRALPKAAWLATAGAFFAIMNAIKLIPYSLNGQWSLQLVAISVVLLPMAYLGVWLGKQIQGRLSETQFMQACRFLLFAVGVSLIWKVV